ncbi:hypothetical protein H8N00_09750 [Streptomyces sp. AC563]|uniref:hypothetical protein n=1 Tax=Streptomyces buecherae TaxID=2763006 RepID=UPI00164E0569|nr:hypothetical protein [Streptomyces buecherae]MBC3983827.1 hypothetical protein [Streptomyces buecherae]MBC3989158.1 hypothetical protein [Streptomyces buecherae]QNJ43957.1 hypothetical protein H7H31_33105 [Streptomyces buecherae]
MCPTEQPQAEQRQTEPEETGAATRPEQVDPKEADETQLTPDLPPRVEVPEANTDASGRPPRSEDDRVGERPEDEPDVPEHPG